MLTSSYGLADAAGTHGSTALRAIGGKTHGTKTVASLTIKSNEDIVPGFDAFGVLLNADA